MVIPFEYSKEPAPFSEGLAVVHCSDNTDGYLDASGKLVIPCQYVAVTRFIHGHAFVRDRNSRTLLIDKQGNIVKAIIAPVELGDSFGRCVKTGCIHLLLKTDYLGV